MAGATYVALGDSYAAGIGSGTTGDRCRRLGGYPPALARRLGVDLAYEACHGATVEDVARVQLGRLGRETRLVTLTVGGNDAGFADVVLAAAKPRCLADGVRVVEAARRDTREHLPLALLRLLRDVRRLAPHAQVVLAGYPHLLAGHDCRWYTFFTEEELVALRSGTDELVDLLLEAADRAGALGVDVRAAFADHHACSADPWIHSLTWPFANTFHPTARGHALYAEAVAQALGVGTGAGRLVVPGPTVDSRESSPSGLPTPSPARADAPIIPGPATTGSAPRVGARTYLAAGLRPPVPPIARGDGPATRPERPGRPRHRPVLRLDGPRRRVGT